MRETLIDGTGTLAPQQAITRGEAALLLYRLFMLLYEPPVAEMAFDGFDSGSSAPGRADGGRRRNLTVPPLPTQTRSPLASGYHGAAMLPEQCCFAPHSLSGMRR